MNNEKLSAKAVTIQYKRSIVHSHLYLNKQEGLAGIYLLEFWLAKMGVGTPPLQLRLTLEVLTPVVQNGK